MRHKNRYFVLQVVAPRDEDEEELSAALCLRAFRESILRSFGDWGAGVTQQGLALRFFNPATGVGVLRVGRDSSQAVRAALTLVTSVDDSSAIVRVLYCGGSLRTTRPAAVKALAAALREASELEPAEREAELSQGTSTLEAMTF